jgi:hypothetical protein
VATPPEARLAWFTAALDELPAFLPSSDVFRPLHPPPARMVHDLSLGLLLLTAEGLKAEAPELAAPLSAAWEQARARWEAVLTSQPAAVEAKARAEIPHRLNLWKAYLQDLDDDPKAVAAYAGEVRHRAVLDQLADLLGGRAPAEAAGALSALDERLRGMFAPGPFVWEAELESRYPRAKYWYLYGRITRG